MVPGICPHSRDTSQGLTPLWQSRSPEKLPCCTSFPAALRFLSDKGCSPAAGACCWLPWASWTMEATGRPGWSLTLCPLLTAPELPGFSCEAPPACTRPWQTSPGSHLCTLPSSVSFAAARSGGRDAEYEVLWCFSAGGTPASLPALRVGYFRVKFSRINAGWVFLSYRKSPLATERERLAAGLCPLLPAPALGQ